MKKNICKTLFFLSTLIVSCMSPKKEIKFELVSHSNLPSLRSVSGIIMDSNGTGFLSIADNEPCIYRTNFEEDALNSFVWLNEFYFDTARTVDGIIPKDIKPDFEAMTIGKWASFNWLILVGSGSKSGTREWMLCLKHELGSDTDTTWFDASAFYEKLRSVAGISIDDFNIEGVCFAEDKVLLFNRGTSGIFMLSADDFMRMIFRKAELKEIQYVTFNLPTLEGYPAGFSDAVYLKDQKTILFTVSVEKTDNWIDDGSIVGSGIGYFSLDDLKDNLTPPIEWIVEKGIMVKSKVEAIDYCDTGTPNKYRLIMATDNDSGVCEMIEYSVEWGRGN